MLGPEVHGKAKRGADMRGMEQIQLAHGVRVPPHQRLGTRQGSGNDHCRVPALIAFATNYRCFFCGGFSTDPDVLCAPMEVRYEDNLGEASLGTARPGQARCGMARPASARLGSDRQGLAWQSDAWRC